MGKIVQRAPTLDSGPPRFTGAGAAGSVAVCRQAVAAGLPRSWLAAVDLNRLEPNVGLDEPEMSITTTTVYGTTSCQGVTQCLSPAGCR